MSDSEWAGEPHTLVVRSVTPPSGPFDDGELEYDIEHPASCTQEERTYLGSDRVMGMVWTCDLAENENECGLASSLKYSGTPITEPGTYRIQSWGRKYYVWDYGAYEYDGGISMIELVIARPLADAHPVEFCYGSRLHCVIHDVDEPADGYRCCFECKHMFVTADDLLAEHNKVLASLGLDPDTDVAQVHCCPLCVHDW